jgi:pimeloyl-ACP methyl ester carboxylesterase
MICMDHSFGGLLTQLLLQRDLGVAGVAVDGAPPMGVLPTQWSFLRFSWPVVNPLILSGVVSVIFGILLIVFPGPGAISLIWLVGW